jgi:hypothetical protein
MTRRLILILAFLIAVPVVAQHRVSRIEVRSSVPDAIITSQSALEEGRSYSDKDLEVAVARLRRLPFVFDARYSLEGETLVLEVDAMTRFFGDLEAAAIGYQSNETVAGTIGGGGRMFLGSGGVLQGGVSQFVSDFNDTTSVEAEYAHYGIAGTRLFAVGGLNYSVVHEDNDFEPDPSLRLTVGYPINVRNTLTASLIDDGYRRSRTLIDAPGPLTDSGDSQALNLRWTYDTSEDPFFARHGLIVSGGPSWGRLKSTFSAAAVTFPDGVVTILRGRHQSDSVALIADAKKYWAHRDRGAFFTAANLTLSRDDREEFVDGSILRRGEVDSSGARVQVGYARNLFDRASATSQTRQRLEFAAGYARQEFEHFSGPVSASATRNTTDFSAAYVLRRNFATVRLGLSYSFE